MEKVMEREQIALKLTELVRPYVTDHALLGALTDDSSLRDDLHINSLHLIDIVLDVEQAFDIEIRAEETDNLNRIGHALAFIDQKLRDKVAVSTGA